MMVRFLLARALIAEAPGLLVRELLVHGVETFFGAWMVRVPDFVVPHHSPQQAEQNIHAHAASFGGCTANDDYCAQYIR